MPIPDTSGHHTRQRAPTDSRGHAARARSRIPRSDRLTVPLGRPKHSQSPSRAGPSKQTRAGRPNRKQPHTPKPHTHKPEEPTRPWYPTMPLQCAPLSRHAALTRTGEPDGLDYSRVWELTCPWAQQRMGGVLLPIPPSPSPARSYAPVRHPLGPSPSLPSASQTRLDSDKLLRSSPVAKLARAERKVVRPCQ